MKKYANYLKERDGMELLESENGFVVYNLQHDMNAIYLAEIFVEKPFRSTREGWKLFKSILKIAKDNGLDTVLGSLDNTTNGWEISENLMIRLGFKFWYKTGNVYYYTLKLR